MKDLIIKNPTYELPSIDYDLQPLKDELEIIKDKYANWAVQESDLENAKKVKASLNSAKTKLDRQRIDLIKEITKPLSEFENELKGIAKEIKEISDSIDNQVRDYEDERKNQKEIEIRALDNWRDFIQFNEKWLNKTYKIEDIEKEMIEQGKLFSNNSLLIANTCKAYDLNSMKYLDMLKDKQDIETIVGMINNDYETKQEYIALSETKEVQTELPFDKEDLEDTRTFSYTLRLSGTKAQLKALKQFIVDNNIDYKKVEWHDDI